MSKPDNTSPGVYVLAKLSASLLMAYLITTYTLPFWVAVILIFIS